MVKIKRILFILIWVLLINIVYAFPDSINLNIQVTDSSGNIATGTYLFNFSITQNLDCSSILYTNSTTETTDSRGIVYYKLRNIDSINVNNSNLYFCYYRDNILKSNLSLSTVTHALYARNTSTSGLIYDSNINASGHNISADTGIFKGLTVDQNVTSSNWFKGLFNWVWGTSSSTFATFNGSTAELTSTLTQWTYNQTTPANSYIDLIVSQNNASWTSTYNATYSIWSYNQTTLSNTYTDNLNSSIQASFVKKLGGNLINGTQDFNGGWTNSGVSIINGNVYTQTLFTYNLTALGVNSLLINGSLLPQIGFDNQFDVGNATWRWRYGYFGTDVYVNGVAFSGLVNNVSYLSSYNVSYAGLMNNVSYLSSYNVSYAGLMNNVSYLSTYNATYQSYNDTYNKWWYNQTKEYTHLSNFTDNIDAVNRNLFDQILNTTSDVTFSSLSASTLNISGQSLLSFSNGNVGIGTTLPTQKLDVQGDINVSNTIYIANGTYSFTTTDGSANQVLTTNGNGTTTWANPSVYGQTYYFWSNTSDIGLYKYLLTTNSIGSSKKTVSTTPVLRNRAFMNFTTESTKPNTNFIPAGLYSIRFDGSTNTINSQPKLYANISRRDNAGTEWQMGLTGQAPFTGANVNITLFLTADIPQTSMNTTDRIVVKFYLASNSASQTYTVSLYMEDGSSSLLTFPSTGLSTTNLVPYSGADQNVILGNNNFSVNTSTLFVNKDLGRVGIGTQNPSNLLNVNGISNFTGNLTVDLNTLFINADGNRVGIGTINPNEALEINGNLVFNSSRRLYVINSSAGLLGYSLNISAGSSSPSASTFGSKGGDVIIKAGLGGNAGGGGDDDGGDGGNNYFFGGTGGSKVGSGNAGTTGNNFLSITPEGIVTGFVSIRTFTATESLNVNGSLMLTKEENRQIYVETSPTGVIGRNLTINAGLGGSGDGTRGGDLIVFAGSGANGGVSGDDGGDGGNYYIDGGNRGLKNGAGADGVIGNVLIAQRYLGKVGIGNITTPTSLLTVAGNISAWDSINATKLCIGVDCRTIWPTGGSGGGNSSWVAGANTIYNDTANVKVGIGTASPNQVLDIRGNLNMTGNFTNVLVIDRLDTTTTGGTLRLTDPVGGANYFQFDNDGYQARLFGTGTRKLAIGLDGSFGIYTDLDIGVGDLFVNDTLDRVGIGTTSPTSLLTVAGNISAWDSINATKLCIGTDCRNSWDNNPFNQILNITSNVNFGNLTINENLTIGNATSFVILKPKSQNRMFDVIHDADTTTDGSVHFIFNSSSSSGGNDADVFRIVTGRGSGATEINIFSVLGNFGALPYFNIMGSGRVGIGTILPESIFNVNGTQYINTTGDAGPLIITAPNINSEQAILMRLNATGGGKIFQGSLIGDSSARLSFELNAPKGVGLFFGNGTARDTNLYKPTNTTDILQTDDDFVINNTLSGLYVRGNASINNSFFVRPNGRVGIGTFTPNQVLQVNGLSNFTGSIYTDLIGVGNAFACINASGGLYRSALACA